ncbi:NADP-dependent oxidoreductase [Amycolatopsis sp. H20-H5]|uniref:NADP-dependent oxidoreductase n=1 Tax=Amycolatopsis sp. H20-H5 TaxID=3046309 RepID=UPI002DBBC5C9|nr:NADP-dependent oxidoreductase [Amycolatopsis sp. H20-H5]MEC3977981.1 NADP-dependent oxidoreductase [Amycolatopsis sp. H20-H5]
MTQVMKAVVQRAFGGPEVLELAEVARPEPGPDEVGVRVLAAGVNPVDWKLRSGAIPAGPPPPYVPGFEISGVVEAVGAGVTRYAAGDEVFGMLMSGTGGYAEYAVAPAATLAPKPAAISHVQAVALPVATLTTWAALVTAADLKAGQRVLIHAAGGAVGHVAVQLAKARGAYVLGTARASKHELLRELGADELIDYTAVDFAEVAGQVDAVFDLVGGDYAPRSLPTLRPGGIYLDALGVEQLRPEFEANGLRYVRIHLEPAEGALDHAAALAAEGRLRIIAELTFPLADAAQAHKTSETGRSTGKIVLTP